MSAFDAYVQVGAIHGLPVHGASSVLDLPREIWRAMTANWNERQLTPEQREEQARTLHTFSDGT